MGCTRMKNYRKFGKLSLFLFGIIAVLSFYGCAKDMATTKMTPDLQESASQRVITSINPVVNAGEVKVSIEATSMLTYTSVKQSLPLGVVLYFPETGFENIDSEYVVDSSVVSAVRTIGPNEDSSTSRVVILLKKDIEYVVNKTETGIEVVFNDDEAVADNTDNSEDIEYVEVNDDGDITETDASEPENSEVAEGQQSGMDESVSNDTLDVDTNGAEISDGGETNNETLDFDNADNPDSEAQIDSIVKTEEIDNRDQALSETDSYDVENKDDLAVSSGVAQNILSVTKEETGESLSVIVNADGAITNYKDFSIKATASSNARIVLDIFDVKSKSRGEEKLKIDNQFADQVRYFSYPDRLRVVVDTKNENLTKYQINTEGNELELTIGNAIDTATLTSQAVNNEESVQKVSAKAGWVNKIDFSSGKDGKSAVVVGMTSPSEYELKKIDDKTIKLVLLNARIPKKRKFPIITTRFNSAIDRITPVLRGPKAGSSELIIELRQMVPYFVDQEANLITINFDPSSIAPRQEDDANLPEWKKVLKQDSGVSAIEVQKNEDTLIQNSENSGEKPIEVAGPAFSPEIEQNTADLGSQEIDGSLETKNSESSDEVELSDNLDAKKEMPAPEIKPESEVYVKKHTTNIGRTRKVYTGEKIAVDFYETDIKNVFRIIRAVSGENFAIDKNVTGTVTMTLDQPVPWDQVLDLVLKMNMLGMSKEGNINRIALLQTLKNEEQQRLDFIKAEGESRKEAKSLEPLKTEYIAVNYSDASSEIKPHLEGILTGGRGKLSVDARTNQVIITDTQEVIEKAKAIVKKIDKETPQVIIESRIVEASTAFARNLGIKWGVKSGTDGIYRSDLGGNIGYDVAMNYETTSNSSVGISFEKLTGSKFLIDATLTAEETMGSLKIVSSPRVVTLDNKTAEISQGVELVYSVTDKDGNVTIEFKPVNLKMSVTPHVTADNRVSLKVDIDKDDVGTTGGIDTKKVVSELLINDGETIVIGGVIKSNYAINETGMPFFSKLPFVGWLFKNKSKSENKQELLIFITPRILHLENADA